ncbi:MAG: pentapeptide repeat-containing protein [Cyanobacteria bacterium SID2]|nr:pentapeptide repeat-containing protein [Cyanobacteria bacterium SID2]MBP0004931.1 pentapeptide repeat-containing protein [Cyanobacteria bacterium SBC]
MTSPSVNSDFDRISPWWRDTVRRMPLLLRRGCAFVLEVSFLVGSAAVPYGLGAYAKHREIGDPVPLSPLLASTEDTIGRVLGLPMQQPNRNVSPLTNLFWTGALVLPLLAGSWQIYLLCKTGQTDPKRWFGVQVATASGNPPKLLRATLREGIGRWGVVGGTAFLLWRLTGAFPDLGILTSLTGVLLLADGWVAQVNRKGRTLHDRIAGTYILDPFQNPYGEWKWSERANTSHWTQTDEGELVDAIVLVPEPEPFPRSSHPSLWWWMRRNPGTTLFLVLLFCLAAVLGTFVGTQVYVQQQANWREQKQQDNQLFLSLVSKLTPEPGAPDERKNAILALGTLNDPRAMSLLVDLLGQETSPPLLDAIQQALTSRGVEAIEELRRLNQALKTDLDSLQYGGTAGDKAIVARRLRATQRAIAKILANYSGEMPFSDLSRTHLGQTTTSDTPFTLVLDSVNLAGIRFRGAILDRASLQGSRFYGPGEDGRFGTYDDWIADLSGADLSHTNLAGATLTNVWMHRTNVMRSNLNHTDARGISANGANFSSAQLVGTDFEGASLRQASLTGADASTADFANADLVGATLTQIQASGSRWLGANLSQSNWQGADLSGADLSRTNLSNTNFRGANLSGASLRLANLQYANFQGSDLSFVDLRGTDVSGADFQGVVWTDDPPQEENTFVVRSQSIDTTSFVEGVDFTDARNLEAEALLYLCANGAIHPQCGR